MKTHNTAFNTCDARRHTVYKIGGDRGRGQFRKLRLNLISDTSDKTGDSGRSRTLFRERV